MSRMYRYHVEIEGHQPNRKEAIEGALNKEWNFDGIDEVGGEFNDASGWGRAALTTLLLTRYAEKRLTVMTSNLDAKAWKAYADPRMLDRLAGEGEVFGTTGPSLRRK